MTFYDETKVFAVLVPCLVLLAAGPVLGEASPSFQADLSIQIAENDVSRRFGLAGQSTEQGDYLLHGYILQALASNQRLATAWANVEKARARIDQASALPDPRFRFTQYIQSVETRVGPQERAYSLSQTVPWFGTLSLRGEVMLEAARATEAKLDQVILEVMTQVKTTYQELVYLEAAIDVTRQHLNIMTQWEDVARVRYSSGQGQYTDLIKAQVELGILQDRLNELEDRRAPLTAALNAVLNRAPGAEVLWKPILATVILEIDNDALLSLLNRDNPVLRAFDHQAEMSLKERQLAGKNGNPSFTLGLNFIETSPRPIDGLADNGKDAVMASLGIKLPLWRGKYRAEAQEAESGLRAARSGRQQELNQLQADLAKALYKYRDAARKHSLYQNTLLPKGHQSLNALQASYEAGESGFLDLVDAQRILLEFELAQARATADIHIQQAVIERLVANPVGE